MRERDVESYLHQQVTAAGGTTRKFSSATRANNPDRIVIWPPDGPACCGLMARARIDFVELKAPGKRARPGQMREHIRLRAYGCQVFVIWSKALIDDYVKRRSK